MGWELKGKVGQRFPDLGFEWHQHGTKILVRTSFRAEKKARQRRPVNLEETWGGDRNWRWGGQK